MIIIKTNNTGVEVITVMINNKSSNNNNNKYIIIIYNSICNIMMAGSRVIPGQDLGAALRNHSGLLSQ